MNKKKLYEKLLRDVYQTLKDYNEKPNHITEDALFWQVDGFNRFARKHKLKEISWTRDDSNHTHKSLSVFYLPFNNLED